MLGRSMYAGTESAQMQAEDPTIPQTCTDASVEYLLVEMVRYYAKEQNHVAAVHAMETVGFQVGSQLAER